MNPKETKSWNELESLYNENKGIHLTERFKKDENRFSEFSIETNELLFDFSKNHINSKIYKSLLNFAEERNLDLEKIKFFKGEKINETENRSVLHQALRADKNEEYFVDGKM